MDIYFTWMMTAGIKLLTQKMDGCLILNKLVRRRVKLYQRAMAALNVNCPNVNIFIVFFLPYPNFAPLSPNIT